MGANKSRSEDPIDKAQLSALRSAVAKSIAISIACIVTGLIGEALPEPRYAALSAVVVGVATAALVGELATLLFAATYLDDRARIQRQFGALTAYVRRAGTWGMAAGGLGALLASALPRRLSEAVQDPGTLPVSGWVAVFFGGVGVGLGILEEWRIRTTSVEAGAPVSDDSSG
jgi:hypothetical protein